VISTHSAKRYLSGHFIALLNQENLALNLSLQYTLCTLRDTIAKSISPLLCVPPLSHLSLTRMDLRYTEAGKAELTENKTGEQALGTPTPAFVDGSRTVGSGTGGSDASGASPNGQALPQPTATPYPAVLVSAPEASERMRLPSQGRLMSDMLLSSSPASEPKRINHSSRPEAHASQNSRFPIAYIPLRV